MPLPCRLQTKSYSPPPERGEIALSANERIAEFLDFAIQDKLAYVNKLRGGACAPPRQKRIMSVYSPISAAPVTPIRADSSRGTAIAPSWPSASSTSIMACCTGALPAT